MLARKFRLPVKEFPRNAQRISSPYTLVKFSLQSRSHNRFAVVISTKTEQSSVRRHRLKRILFELLALWPPVGVDAILIIKEFPKAEEHSLFVQDVKELGERISRSAPREV
jgi:ribonuclease P protein component